MRLVEPLAAEQAAGLIAAARSLLGKPWRHQGRTERGMDCIGMLVLSFRAIGVSVEDRTDYGRTPHNKRLRAGLCERFGEPVGDLRPGDIVTLRWTGEENHVALVTPHPDYGLGLIHCYAVAPGGTRGGRVIEHGLDEHWRSLIVEAWRPFAEGAT